MDVLWIQSLFFCFVLFSYICYCCGLCCIVYQTCSGCGMCKATTLDVKQLVLPLDTKNPYRLSKLLYRSIIDISTSWHLILGIIPVVFYLWAIIEELSMRRQIHTFLISWEQNTRAKHCYVDLSSWHKLWFAIICFDMNVTLALSTAIQQFRDGFDSK